MNAGLKAQHDLLLSFKPDGAEHDAAQCPICQETPINDDNHPGGGSVTDKTFSEAELQAAVDKAVSEATAPLLTKVSEFENSQQQTEIDAKIAALAAEKDAAIAELQTRLDASVIEATTAKADKEALEKFLADAAAEQEETAAREARRDQRLATLKDEAGFPEDYLKENADRFVAMSDEEFAARVEEYKALVAKGAGNSTPPPSQTSLNASRINPSNKPDSALREVLDLRRAGVDPRHVRS